MENGYYLSAYLNINPLANLYNISLRHDQTVALWYLDKENVQLIRYWELERKTGLKKHSKSFFSVEQCKTLLNNLLSEVDLSMSDIKEIWGTPGLEKEGIVTRYSSNNPCPYHTLAHLFSGLLIDTESYYNGKTLAFALDGGPDNVVDKLSRDKKFYWGCYCESGEKTYFPVYSPGAFWSMLRLKFNMEEGSLMALGSASTAYINNMERFIRTAPLVEDGSGFNDAFEWIETISNYVNSIGNVEIQSYDNRFSDADNRLSIIVKIVQEASKKVLKTIVENAIDRFNIIPQDTNLTMTGGFALNCPTNSYLMNQFQFKEFSTCPCVSDSGIALGIGLYEFSCVLDHFDFKLINAYHGSSDNYASSDSDMWNKYINRVDEFSPEQFAEDVYDDLVVWFDGQSEIGPRALGARSILGNPAKAKTKDSLNDVKKRQWWRPVAPIIISGKEDEWFLDSFHSPYMLCTCYIKEDKKALVPAILHIDGSARIQSLPDSENTRLVSGIHSFYKKTGIPIICNTSLNDKGEPIIDSFDQCMNFALRKNIPIVYFNGWRIKIENHDLYQEKNPYPRRYDWIDLPKEKTIEEQRKLNPWNLTEQEIDIFLNVPELIDFDITNAKDVRKLKRILEQWKRLNNSVWSAMLL